MYTPGYFKDKKITVMGLGLLGRGVGDIKFLAEEGAELIVTDLKTKEQLASSLEALRYLNDKPGIKPIKYVLGDHNIKDFRNRDFILKAAGVPLDSVYIAEARKNNIPVEMSSSLFASLTQATVVGITGTRGKSTVTYLLYEVIKKAHENRSQKIFLGGNVRGIATLPFLKETKKGDIAVLELDSWQLQGFGEKKISPHLSIFTTFYPDHMNYYKNSLEVYLGDKANIFKYQKPEDILILGTQAEQSVLSLYKKIIQSKVITADAISVPEGWKIAIPGEHNRYNAGLVYEASRALGIEDSCIKDIFEHFNGLSGRLEFVQDYKGTKIYNDTNSTTPDATLAGLKALGQNQDIVLIMGGADKQLDMSELLKQLPIYAKAIILLSGSGTDRIKQDLEKIAIQHSISVKYAFTLDDALTQAFKECTPEDTLLFSPAFASFGMFKNEYDRGDQFIALLKELTTK